MNRTNGGVNLLALRSHNTALVLDLLRSAGAGGISRLELAERTGLTPQAVSKITARLREEGLVADAGHRASTGGKPRTVLRLVPEAGHAIGIHLDRDALRAVLVDLAGTVLADRSTALDLGAGAEAVVETVAGEVEALVNGVGAGLGEGCGAGGAGLGTGPAAGMSAGPDTGSVAGGVAGADAGSAGGIVAGWDAGPAAGISAGADAGSAAAVAAHTAGGSTAEASGQARASAPAPASALRSAAVPESDSTSAATSAQAPASPPEPASPSAPASARPPAPTQPPTPLPNPASTSAPAPLLLGVGVALPGPLDHTRGVLHRVTGFPEWGGFPLRDALVRRLGVPVAVDKDTNAAALGLAVAGERGSFAYLHLGTGLGAGLVIDGTVHRGARTAAGEFGHQVVQLDGPPCGCGDRGCVEALCLTAVARGDLTEAARVLGIAAGNLVALLDIDLVLLGGRTVATAPDAFLRGVAAVLGERARRTGEETVPVRAAVGEVAEGAAQLVLAPLFGRADA